MNHWHTSPPPNPPAPPPQAVSQGALQCPRARLPSEFCWHHPQVVSEFHQRPRGQLLCNTQQALQAPGDNLPMVSPSTSRGWVPACWLQLAAPQATFHPRIGHGCVHPRELCISLPDPQGPWGTLFPIGSFLSSSRAAPTPSCC